MRGKNSGRFPYMRALILATGVFLLPTLARASDIAEFRAKEERSQALVDRMVNATVHLTNGRSFGSGVIVTEDGLIMTASHVLDKPGTVWTVIFSDGRRAKAKALVCDNSHDAGLARIMDKGKWSFVEKGRSADLQLGTWCMAVGYPGGKQPGRKPPVRLGRILAVRKEYLTTDATIAPGDSGGPLLDFDGRVIGIHSSISSGPRENVHVSVDSFQKCWDDLARTKESSNASRSDPDDAGALKFSKASKKLLSRLTDVTARAGQSTVAVRWNGKTVALGTVVRKEGYVLTKASQLPRGRVSCRIADRELPATIVNRNEEYDLALLHVEADDLTPVEWTAGTEGPLGTWLITPDAASKPLALGVLSQIRRKMRGRAFLGISLNPNQRAATVQQVVPDSPARKAGLRRGDVIVALDDQPILDNDSFTEKLGMHKPGDRVTITVKRDGQTIPLTVTLVARVSETDQARLSANLDPNQDAATVQGVVKDGPADEVGLRRGDVIVAIDGRPTPDASAVIAALGTHRVGDLITLNVKRDGKRMPLTVMLDSAPDIIHGRLSRRRHGFPSVFTHDSLLLPTQCGGPILDLSGQAVGLNIARADRTATYALPAEILPGLVADLLAGSSLPPAESVAIQAVEKLGGKVIRKGEGHPVIEVDLSGWQGKALDAALKELQAFPKLQTLTLNGTPVTDAGLKELKELKGLQVLRLTGCTRVTNAGLKELKKLKELKELRLGSTRVSDAGLKEIKELKELRILGLAGTEVTDRGLKELTKLRTLKELVLEGTPVTPAGMAALRKALPKLTIVATIRI